MSTIHLDRWPVDLNSPGVFVFNYIESLNKFPGLRSVAKRPVYYPSEEGASEAEKEILRLRHEAGIRTKHPIPMLRVNRHVDFIKGMDRFVFEKFMGGNWVPISWEAYNSCLRDTFFARVGQPIDQSVPLSILKHDNYLHAKDHEPGSAVGPYYLSPGAGKYTDQSAQDDKTAHKDTRTEGAIPEGDALLAQMRTLVELVPDAGNRARLLKIVFERIVAWVGVDDIVSLLEDTAKGYKISAPRNESPSKSI